MKNSTDFEVHMKGLIDTLTEQTKAIFSIRQFKDKIEVLLKDEYIKGIEEVDRQIKPPVNTVLPSNTTRQLEALYNYVEQNIQDHVDQIGSRLRQELQRGLLNGETKKEIIQRIKRVFKDDKDVINRLKVVVRTESNRAANTGRLEAANQAQEAGIDVVKWLDVHPYQKGRSSHFCNTPSGENGKKSAKGKYGSVDKAIALDKQFIVTDKNKTTRSSAPPFHPNCRTTLRIHRVGAP